MKTLFTAKGTNLQQDMSTHAFSKSAAGDAQRREP